MSSRIFIPFALGLNIIKYVLIIYMYAHALSRKLLQKLHFENLTFSQMTFREIPRLYRTSVRIAYSICRFVSCYKNRQRTLDMWSTVLHLYV